MSRHMNRTPSSTRIAVLSPPFYSHFYPLAALAAALRDAGAETYLGCSEAFENEVSRRGLQFCEININRNANTGQAGATQQAERERKRLHEFLDATKRGPIETLRTQNRHRLEDMLANPEELIERVGELNASLRPDLWVVDQLSYGVTLALIAHGLRFVTFCPPHPLSIPPHEVVYSVPPRWPRAFSVSSEQIAVLTDEALTLEREFTDRFNRLLTPFGREVGSAFRSASPELVLHNYPELPEYRRLDEPPTELAPSRRAPGRVYCGYSFSPGAELGLGLGSPEAGAADAESETRAARELWGEPARESVESPRRIVVALGTFLAARDDVLTALTTGLRAIYPDATIAVGAGEHTEELRRRLAPPAIIEPFIAQRELLRDAELFVHHGGVSSLTEGLYHRVPMIVMPFSSDQFNVAADLERHGFGAVLNPNEVTGERLREAVEAARSKPALAALEALSRQVRGRGPRYAAEAILELLKR